MKLNPNFLTHFTRGEHYIIGTADTKFKGIVKNNETAAFIVESLKTDTTESAVVDGLLAEYEGAERAEVERDAVVIEKLADKPRRYDLALYARGGEQGVIHRVIRARGDKYIICGDNCWQLEYVGLEQIKGVVTEYCRKGKRRGVDYLPYRLYARIWVDLLFLKRPVFYVRDKIKRKLKRRR